MYLMYVGNSSIDLYYCRILFYTYKSHPAWCRSPCNMEMGRRGGELGRTAVCRELTDALLAPARILLPTLLAAPLLMNWSGSKLWDVLFLEWYKEFIPEIWKYLTFDSEFSSWVVLLILITSLGQNCKSWTILSIRSTFQELQSLLVAVSKGYSFPSRKFGLIYLLKLGPLSHLTICVN